MPRCVVCGDKFKVSEARSEFDSRFPSDISYEDSYPDHDYCASCAIAETEGLINQGAAVDMMNGDLDYDDEFVKKWL